MKPSKNLSIFLILFFQMFMFGQTNLQAFRKIDTIQVSDIKTTHLLFKEKLKYLDIGSQFFVLDTLNNVIKIKHTGKSLSDSKSKETNLTVLTHLGSYYSLNLMYNRNPKVLTYSVEPSSEMQERGVLANRFSKKEEENLCSKKFTIKKSKKIGENDDVSIFLKSVFYDKDKVYLVFDITNHSKITLDVGQILFRTKLHKKPRKDFVYQEQQFKPQLMCGKYESVYPKTISSLTFVFDKFTFSEEEDFQIDVLEKNGGRTVYGYIKRKDFFRNEEL